MPEILKHITYLSKEIGPRPAGTEEEQQAALYIAETMQKETGLKTAIEDFHSLSGSEAPRVICCVAAILVTVLPFFFPILTIASIVVVLLAALLFACEIFDRPVISQILPRGVSQNVVAKYNPTYSGDGSSRRRKIVLVSRYDSGKVQPELKGPVVSALPILRRVEFGAMVFLPLLLIIKNVFFFHTVGTVAMVLNVLTVIALVILFLPVLGALIHKFSAYNDGANCNASGVGVLMDVALRVGQGRIGVTDVSTREEMLSPLIHGEEAARKAGLVLDGTQLTYEAANKQSPEEIPQTPEARLAAAKAAVAALSGRPVRGNASGVQARPFTQQQESALVTSSEEATRGTHGARSETLGKHSTTTPDETRERVSVGKTGATVDEMAEKGVFGRATESEEMSNNAKNSIMNSANQGKHVSTGSSVPVGNNSAPDWFKKAQEKAKKSKDGATPVQRSRYADALDVAVGESASHFSDAMQAVFSETEQRLRQVRESIMEVKAPGFEGGVSPIEGAPSAAEPIAANRHSSITASVGTSADVINEEQANGSIMDSYEDDRLTIPALTGTSDSGGSRQSQEQSVPHRRPITLPSIGTTASMLPVTEMQKQRAPLAEVESSGKAAAKSLLSLLPSIDLNTDTNDDSNRAAGSSAATLDSIPSVFGATSTQDAAGTTRQSQRNNSVSLLKDTLPSLSGSFSMQGSIAPDKETSLVDTTEIDESMSSDTTFAAASSTINITHEGAFTPGATGSFAPVGNALLENVDPHDIFIDDVDDSGYDGNVTETGAFAGPGYVEMPKSRAHRLLEKLHFGKHKKNEEQTPREWLNVDESFDARSVGAARGGWESFNTENDSYSARHYADDYNEENPDGVVAADSTEEEMSRVTTSKDFLSDEFSDYSFGENSLFDSGPKDTVTDFSFDGSDEGFTSEQDDDYSTGSTRRRWHGGAFSSRMIQRVNETRLDTSQEAMDSYQDASNQYGDQFAKDQYGSDSYDGSLSSEPFVPDNVAEFNQINRFHRLDINTEVWFVALGSELAQNGGMRAFLKEHAQDLRGSIIIDLDAMGAGDLSLIEREGSYRGVTVSSRMKRYVKKAAQAVGVQVSSAQLRWQDSAASYAIKQGYQAMHLVGMSGSKPAYYAQGDDDLGCIEEDLLLRNSDFVIELIKNI